MKTLEPFHVTYSRGGDRYYVDTETAHPESTADLYADRKRFKPGELAAEYWKQWASVEFVLGTGREPIRTSLKLEVFERFATLPSAV